MLINSLDRRNEQVTLRQKPVQRTEQTSAKQEVSSHSMELYNVRDIHLFVDIIYTFW